MISANYSMRKMCAALYLPSVVKKSYSNFSQTQCSNRLIDILLLQLKFIEHNVMTLDAYNFSVLFIFLQYFVMTNSLYSLGFQDFCGKEGLNEKANNQFL